MMFIKSEFKSLALSFVLSVTLLLGAVSLASGGGAKEPPSGTEKQTGPSINGTVVINSDGLGYVTTFVFNGKCNGNDIHFEKDFTNQGLELPTTALDLAGFRLPNGQATIGNACEPSGGTGSDDIIVNSVKKFESFGDTVIADLSVHWIVPR